MAKNSITDNVVSRIKSKYPYNKIRLALKYYDMGIPERFWFQDASISKSVKQGVEDGKWLAVFGSSNYDTSEYISTLVKNIVSPTKTIHLHIFSELMLVSTNRQDKPAIKQLWHELDMLDVVVITDVAYGNKYDGYLEDFFSMLNRFVNSPINKQVILGMEKIIDQDKKRAAYSDELFDKFIDTELFDDVVLR
jgi:hypothetical protein